MFLVLLLLLQLHLLLLLLLQQQPLFFAPACVVAIVAFKLVSICCWFFLCVVGPRYSSSLQVIVAIFFTVFPGVYFLLAIWACCYHQCFLGGGCKNSSLNQNTHTVIEEIHRSKISFSTCFSRAVRREMLHPWLGTESWWGEGIKSFLVCVRVGWGDGGGISARRGGVNFFLRPILLQYGTRKRKKHTWTRGGRGGYP